MADVKQIVADTLRTMMGATAADPYVRAIEKAIDAAEAAECGRHKRTDLHDIPVGNETLIIKR